MELLVSREELMRMLSELSDEALQYVKRPILYAYYYTDDRDPERLSDDDMDRLSFIRAVVNDSPEVFRRVSPYLSAIRYKVYQLPKQSNHQRT